MTAGTLQIVVMAKWPARGRVKTRLAADLGDAAACALQSAFVRDLAQRLADAGHRPLWAVEPADAPFTSLLPGARVVGQVAGDLGARMAAAMDAAWRSDPRPVLVLGADTPHLPMARLAEAADALAAGADVVLGPARDGGYYAIALSRPAPGLFVDVTWGGNAVLATTMARAAAHGLAVARLAEEFDVDTLADLRELAALVANGGVALPHTAHALRAAGVEGPAS